MAEPVDLSVIALVAAGVMLFGLFSERLRLGLITSPMAFTGLGLLLAALGLVQLDAESAFITTLTELALVVILYTDASRIDLSLLKREYRFALRLLAVGLPLTIVAGTLTGLLVLGQFGFWELALLAAILAPTDAALGQAVVTDECVPVRVRQTLNVESGLNDGLALPVVLLFVSVAGMETGSTVSWLRFVTLQLLLAPVIGVGMGYLGGELTERAVNAGWMNRTFLKLSSLALALLTFSSAELMGGNGFITVFVTGLTLGNRKRELCERLFEFAEAEGQLLTLSVFLVFGAVMVGPALTELSWRSLLYTLLSLTAVRMLPVALSLPGSGLRPYTALFLGWFGPRGIASIIYGLLLFEYSLPQAEPLFQVVVLTVLLSVVLHGLSAAPLAARYGKAMRNNADMPEAKPVTELPLRY